MKELLDDLLSLSPFTRLTSHKCPFTTQTEVMFPTWSPRATASTAPLSSNVPFKANNKVFRALISPLRVSPLMLAYMNSLWLLKMSLKSHPLTRADVFLFFSLQNTKQSIYILEFDMHTKYYIKPSVHFVTYQHLPLEKVFYHIYFLLVFCSYFYPVIWD